MTEQCSVDGCDRTAQTKGWCQAHYMRWWHNGDVGTAPIASRSPGRTCSLDGCDRKHQGRGYCDTHLQRFLKYGDPGPAAIEPRRPGAICSIEGCERPHRARGWCDAHHQRWRKTGSPTTPFLEHHHQWTGDDATYTAVHQRLRKQKGRADAFTCVSCGAPARHWSYDHTDPAEKVDDRGIAYSVDLSHYNPMCQPCHRRFDVRHMPVVTCSADGCDRPQKARALCPLHYDRWRRARARASAL